MGGELHPSSRRREGGRDMVLSLILEMWAEGMEEKRSWNQRLSFSPCHVFFSWLSGCLTLLISFLSHLSFVTHLCWFVFTFPVSYLGMPQEPGFSILHPHVFVSEFTPLVISSKFCGLTIVCILMVLKIIYNKDLNCRFLNSCLF